MRPQPFPRQRAGSRDAGARKHAKPAKVIARCLGRLGDDWQLQAPADRLGNFP